MQFSPMNLLIFGNSSYPDISFKLDPMTGLRISCKNNHVLDYEGAGDTVTWVDLFNRTAPTLSIPDFGNSISIQGWTRSGADFKREEYNMMKEKLWNLVQSSAEKMVLQGYFEISETFVPIDEPRKMAEIARLPALIPQVWLNWIHYDSADKARAKRVQEEPFRVDFVMFYNKRKIVLEIDGPSHFSEVMNVDEETGVVKYEPSMKKYTEHVRKDRWLRTNGWEVWRFTDIEVSDKDWGLIALLYEIGCERIIEDR